MIRPKMYTLVIKINRMKIVHEKKYKIKIKHTKPIENVIDHNWFISFICLPCSKIGFPFKLIIQSNIIRSRIRFVAKQKTAISNFLTTTMCMKALAKRSRRKFEHGLRLCSQVIRKYVSHGSPKRDKKIENEEKQSKKKHRKLLRNIPSRYCKMKYVIC